MDRLATSASRGGSAYAAGLGTAERANGRFVSTAALAAAAASNVGGSAAGAVAGVSALSQVNLRLASSFQEADNTRKGLEQGIGRLGDSLQSIGQSFSTYVTLPITGAVAAAGKAAIDFESAFAGVKKTLNTNGLSATETTAEYGRLAEGIRSMAREIPAATTEIAGVAEAAGQLGIKRENVLEFTRVMVDLGNSTNLAASDAATSLARLANITGLPQTQFQNLGSTIVALGNNFATTEREITEMGLRIAGAGKQVGLTEAQTLGFATALSSVGIEAEAGGTAFSTVIKRIQGATETGGKTLDGFAKVAGLSASAFKQAFQTDAAGATLSFVEGLGRIKEQGGSTLQALTELDLADIRVSDSLLRLSGAGDLARRSVALGTDAFRENTALAKEAGQRYETTASQIQIAKNRLNDIAITIGASLLPLIKSGTSAIGGLSDGLKNISPTIVQAGLTLAGLAAATGPVLFGIGAITKAIPTLRAGMLVLSGPVGAVALAVAAASYLIYENWDKLVAYFTTGEGGKVFSGLATSAKAAVKAVSDAFSGLGGGTFADLASGATALGFVFEELGRGVTAVFDVITASVNSVSALFRGDFITSINEAGAVLEALTRPVRRLLGLTSQQPNSSIGEFFKGQFDAAAEAARKLDEEMVAGAVAGGDIAASLEKAGKAAGGAAALTEDQVKALEALRAALLNNYRQAQAFGASYDYVGGRVKVLQSGIESLVKVGFDPLGTTVQRYVGQLNSAAVATEQLATRLSKGIPAPKVEQVQAIDTNPLAELPENIDASLIRARTALSQPLVFSPLDSSALLEQLNAARNAAGVPITLAPFDYTAFQGSTAAIEDLTSRVVNSTTGMSNAAVSAIAAFNDSMQPLLDSINTRFTDFAVLTGEAFGGVITGVSSIGDAMRGALAGALGILGDFIKEYAKKVVALGIANLAINPVKGALQIAAGVALAAAAGVASSAGSGLTASRGGGATATPRTGIPTVSTPTTARATAPTVAPPAEQNNTMYVNVMVDGKQIAQSVELYRDRLGRIVAR